jgi:hypothetical protein
MSDAARGRRALSRDVRALVVAIVVLAGRVAAADVTLRGYVVAEKTRAPLAGVTVLASSVGHETATTFSDETGRFELAVAPGRVTLTYFYLDTTTEQVVAVAGEAGAVVEVGTTAIAESRRYGCVYIVVPDTYGLWSAQPFALDASSPAWPIVRVRDVDAIVGLAAGAMPGTTLVDGARRLAAAPALRLALLREVEVYTMRGSGLAERAAGVSVTTLSGSNELHGAARASLGSDGAALEASAGGAIVADHAWWQTAAAADPRGDQELARVDVAKSYAHQGRVEYVRAVEAIAPPVGARVVGSVADDWADAAWRSRFQDNKLELDAGATGERFAAGAATTLRGAGRASISRRLKLAGYHELRAGGEYGAGRADDIAHRDASAWFGDRWTAMPSLVVEAGARYDARWFGAATAAAWQPRATIAWDWTKEGRADLFATAARGTTLDDTGPATPVAGAHARDDSAIGARYELRDTWVGGIAARARDELGVMRYGADATLGHHTRRVDVELSASSLERAVAGTARATAGSGAHRLVVGASGRWGETGSWLGGSIAWRRSVRNQPSTNVGVEAVTGAGASIARVVVSIDR